MPIQMTAGEGQRGRWDTSGACHFVCSALRLSSMVSASAFLGRVFPYFQVFLRQLFRQDGIVV